MYTCCLRVGLQFNWLPDSLREKKAMGRRAPSGPSCCRAAPTAQLLASGVRTKSLSHSASWRGTISVIARLSFKKASLAEAFHFRPIFFPFLCLGKFFNISIKGVAMEA